MPTYMDDSNRGFGLTDGGYYFAISDQMDLKLRADIFTKGSWALNMESNYVKRYKYSGLLQASYQVTKTGDKGLPDYSVAKDFKRGCGLIGRILKQILILLFLAA